MSDPVAWSIAAVAIISALSTAVVNIIIALRAEKRQVVVADKLVNSNAAVTTKLDTAAEKQEEIHQLVNSNLTRVKDALLAAEVRIASLEMILANKEQA